MDEQSIAELERLYSSMSATDRAELLQELLVAAALGGEAMVAVVDVWLLDLAGRAFIDALPDASDVR